VAQRSAPLFLPIAQRHLQDLSVRVVPSTLFDRAQLIGAAAYWREERMDESAGQADRSISKDSMVAS
jgi:hypothetical protein